MEVYGLAENFLAKSFARSGFVSHTAVSSAMPLIISACRAAILPQPIIANFSLFNKKFNIFCCWHTANNGVIHVIMQISRKRRGISS